MLEQALEAQAERIGTLEAAAQVLLQRGHPEAQTALGRCRAVLQRYLWQARMAGTTLGWRVSIRHPSLPLLSFPMLSSLLQG